MGLIGSETTAEGRTTTYEYDGTNSGPVGIITPDGQTSTSISYDTGSIVNQHGVPSSITVFDWQDPTNKKSTTTYDYYTEQDSGVTYWTDKLKSVTLSSGLETRYTYYPTGANSGKAEWVYSFNESDDHGGQNGTLYSQTNYNYSTGTLPNDTTTYGLTTIREYAGANNQALSFDASGNVSPVAAAIGDRITKHYYYLNGGLNTLVHAESQEVVSSLSPETTELVSLTLYEYEESSDHSDPMYGKASWVKEVDIADPNLADIRRSTHTEYYLPDSLDLYSVDPDNQYGSDTQGITPSDLCYETGGSGPYYALGNGETRLITVTSGSTSYTTAFRYMVTKLEPENPTSTAAAMSIFPTITRNESGYLSQNVLDDIGRTVELWQDDGSQSSASSPHTFVKTRSISYNTCDPEDPTPLCGLIATETAYSVASDGSPMVTSYSHTFSDGEETATTTVCPGVTGLERNTTAHYNVLGQLDWQQDEYGKQTDYTYDYRGSLVTTTYPLVTGDSVRRTSTNYYLECCGLLDYVREERGTNDFTETHYAYDGMGRTLKTWTNISGQSESQPLVVYNYDEPFGRQHEVTTQSAASTPRTTSYTYDVFGHMTQTAYPSGLVGPEDYLYDEYGRLALKRVVKDTDVTPTVYNLTAYSYDDLDRVSIIDYDYQGSFEYPLTTAMVADATYSYDGVSSRVTNVSGGSGWSHLNAGYTYDYLGRLKTYTPGLPAGYGTISYEYNWIGQKTSMTVPLGKNNEGRKIVCVYDASNRRSGMEIAPVALSSDADLDDSTASQTTMLYDDNQNRVKLVTTNNSTSYKGTYYYVYDPTASIPAVVYEQGPTDRYLNIREPDGSLVSREKYDGETGERTQSRTYHYDGLGSTVALTDETGAVTDRYVYDAWGNLDTQDSTVTTEDNPYQFVGQLGYYAHYQEPDLGLMQLGVRFYDASVGRFAA